MIDDYFIFHFIIYYLIWLVQVWFWLIISLVLPSSVVYASSVTPLISVEMRKSAPKPGVVLQETCDALLTQFCGLENCYSCAPLFLLYVDPPLSTLEMLE